MPFGYSYFEFFDIEKKRDFLKKNLTREEIFITSCFHFLTRMFVLCFIITFIFSPYIGMNPFYFNFAFLCIHSASVQNFRRYMYFKYGYYKNDSVWKIIIGNVLLLIGFLSAVAFFMGFSVFG